MTNEEFLALLRKYKSGECKREPSLLSLDDINDWSELRKMRGNTPRGSVPEKQIEARMGEIVSTINDWSELRKMRGNTPSGSVPEKQIEARMGTLISAVTIEDPPDWFVLLLKKPSSCPVEDVLDTKVADLRG